MAALHDLDQADRGGCPAALGADPAAGPGARKPGTLLAAIGRPEAPCGHALPGRFLPALAGASGLRPLSGALALALPLTLAGCEADPINARAVIEDWGYRAVGVAPTPSFGRPCRFGEPYAARFTARDPSGAPVQGWLCSTDESGEDARILLDQGDA